MKFVKSVWCNFSVHCQNKNPLSIYHHSVNTMNKEFQNDGDRLKEVLTKSIGRERIILPLQFSNHQYFLSHYRS